ncbi:unnamed protein product [Mytilus edulis]|uniref:Uncharacterized protein n=1 Tax=Mytilus edulis TaxID=6550 RepID=A0A8S3TN34_MYTED|nr:unnamed protein product [Mytilus edulis]
MVETADEDMVDLLKFLNDGKYLRDTLVILMSDHGARFSSLRSSLQGKQEERLPFFGFSFPEWFKSKHSAAYQNFKLNVDRLTCPFDLHPTFLDILNFRSAGKGETSNGEISLFKEIPKTRTCDSAGIANHWCACLNWESLNNEDQAVLKVSNYVVSEINKLTEPHRKLCQKLTLKNVLRAQKLLPETDMLLFKKTNDADGFRADLSDNTAIGQTTYQVWVYTTPGDGLFEVTVNHNVQADTFILHESSISRVNKYGDAPKCIETEHEELKLLQINETVRLRIIPPDTSNSTEPQKPKRSDKAEDKLLVNKLRSATDVIRNERQENQLSEFNQLLNGMEKSEAVTEHKIRCGICKEIKQCVQQIEIMKDRLNTSSANTMINVSLTVDLPV